MVLFFRNVDKGFPAEYNDSNFHCTSQVCGVTWFVFNDVQQNITPTEYRRKYLSMPSVLRTRQNK